MAAVGSGVRDADVGQRVRKAVAQVLGVEEAEVGNDMDLQRDLGADSLDLVELAMELEQVFALPAMSDEQVQGIRTVQQAIDQVVASIGSGAAK